MGVFDTNVIGAALITSAALPHLTASSGTAAYLSSVSASSTPPWPGLGAYAVSKAALDKLVEAWRAEHPKIGFTRVTVGDCAGGEGDSMTEFTAGWDQELTAEMAPIWMARELHSRGAAGRGRAGPGPRHPPAVWAHGQHPHRRRRPPTPGVTDRGR